MPIPRGSPWTDEENRATVEAYLNLREALLDGQPVVKSHVYKELVEGPLFRRSAKAAELKFQNLSHEMEELGFTFIPGLAPRANTQASLGQMLKKVLSERGLLDGTRTVPEGRLSARPEGVAEPIRTVREVEDFLRDPRVVAYVLKRAEGRCEACRSPAPFSRPDGSPYLEVHHLRRLADGGSDRITNAVAVCPNCHRRLHGSADAEAYRAQVYSQVSELVPE